jgi:O-antigen ligase
MTLFEKSTALIYSREDKWVISGFYSLCITIFLLPFPRVMSLWSLGTFMIIGLICWIKDFRKIKNEFHHHLLKILPPVLYFLLYIIYFLFGDHIWVNVEDKLMFLVIPLFGLPIFISEYLKFNIRKLLLIFISGLLVICIYQFSRATIESFSYSEGTLKFNYLISAGESRFIWDRLSNFEHPSYLAIKVLWAIVLLLFSNCILRIKPLLSSVLVIIFSVFIFFLAAKAEILILLILLICFLLSWFKSRTSWVMLLILIPLILVIFVRIAEHNIRIEQKIDQIEGKKAAGKIDWKEFDHRTRSWFCSLELIKESPFLGVGLNARDILAEEYRSKGYNIEADARLNSHNQYLETQLTLGIPGTIILFWMLITPLLLLNRKWNPSLAVPFLIIVTVSMVFESILVRQWGIMFFVLFYCILTIPGKTTVLQND